MEGRRMVKGREGSNSTKAKERRKEEKREKKKWKRRRREMNKQLKN